MGSMGGVNVVKPPDIIIIEDDNEGVLENDDQVEFCDTDFDSDAGSRKVPSGFKASVSLQSCDDLSSTSSELSSSSDEEECLVIEPGPSVLPRRRQKLFYRARKRPAKRRRRALSSSSDCEIVEDLCGKGRQDWEEAALRKRMGGVNNTSRFRAESEGSTSASNLASNAGKENLATKEKDHVEENGAKVEGQGKTCQFASANPVPPVSSVFSKEREDTLVDQQDSNDDLVDECVEVTEVSIREVTPLAGVACTSSGNDMESAGGVVDTAVAANADDSLPEGLSPLEGCDDSSLSKEVDERIPKDKAPEGVGFLCSEIDRERLKETDEFRHADEEEWARRQSELKKQAQEAQRERKRRRLEAERRMEMENRQRRRLEEIRQSQMEEEQNLGYKELVRGRVRSELERVAASCKDMATLLRRLGIPVDGGLLPTAQHVNAAYKKALLRFHPDRVAGMAKSDPLQQVEAEETFKLISRMKSTLEPVALRIFP